MSLIGRTQENCSWYFCYSTVLTCSFHSMLIKVAENDVAEIINDMLDAVEVCCLHGLCSCY
jgi:hypothetical protein